ncbi:MAG: Ppx/GppA phosphatase family protein [bacterium]
MFATIDIGTNSILLLIGEPQQDGSVLVSEDRALVTRLGQGLVKSGEISRSAADRTLHALSEYKRLCDERGVSEIAAVGTAALRNASNAATFIEQVRREFSIDIEVISAEREATLTYEGSAHDFGPAIAVIDIGGGSTEIIAQKRDPHGKLPGLNIVSLPLGCVTLTEKYLHSDPVTHAELHDLRAAIHASLEERLELSMYARPNDLEFVATAGTATTLSAMHQKLARYEPEAVHGSRMKMADLRDILDDLVRMTLEERKRIPGLIPERADVILAGAELLHDAMSYLGYADVTISDRGARWGLFYEKFCAQHAQ